MALEIFISLGSDLPLYRQIYQQVRRAVTAGTLAEGHQLPSVRALAERLVINPNTVARAYNELVRDGVVETQQGRGIFVGKARQVLSDKERERRCLEALDIFLDEAIFLDFRLPEIRKLLDQAWQHFEKNHKRKE